MAQDIVINGKTFAGVEAISAKNTDGNTVTYRIGGEVLLLPTDYADYIRVEAAAVAQRVRNVLTSESIVSICMSDSHYPADENTRLSGLHAAMAIKALTYQLPVDFIAHLGDVGFEGSSQSNTDLLESNITEMLSYVCEGSGSSIPLFLAIGNHDPGNYITTSDDTDMVDPAWLYRNFTAKSASDNTVIAGENVGGYCYRDFPSKKLRVFLLNTSEGIISGGYNNDVGTEEGQRAWFAAALKNLNTKSDAAQWKFIVLCHYPADYGANRPMSNLLAAYVNGTSITLSGTTYNFSGANAAKFLVQHHGHIHNFLVDKLYTGSTPTQYDAYRVGIPNSQYNRENYYGEFNGIQYSESTNYSKVPGSAKDTSFVVNVINPSEEMIYSFCYGVGYDRVISYAGVTYYSISNKLTNITSDNPAVALEEGQAYSATLTPTVSGYEFTEVTVTMDGVDITASVYNDGVITIPKVTGNVVITAKAAKAPTSNLHLIAEAADSTEPFNGTGYKNGVYLSSDSSGYVTDTGADAAMVTTGFIPYKAPVTGLPPTVIISGAEWQAISHCRMYFINANKKTIVSPWISGNGAETMDMYYTLENLGDKHFKLIPKKRTDGTGDWAAGGGAGTGTSAYVRFSLVGTGEDLIITFEDAEEVKSYTVTSKLTNVSSSNANTTVESGASYSTTLTATKGALTSVSVTMGGVDITSTVYSNGKVNVSSVTGNLIITAVAAVTYSVTRNLTYVSCSNSAASVNEGSSYSATLVAADGYSIDSVSVKMGGADITATAYSGGKITIGNVTGNIVITATAVKNAQPNQLPLSTDTDGSPYNGGTGFKSGYRISSSGSGEKTESKGFISGYIPYTYGQTITLHNVGNAVFNYNESMLIGFTALSATAVLGDVTLRTEATVNDDGTLTITADMLGIASNAGIKYIRLSCSYLGTDSAVYIE